MPVSAALTPALRARLRALALRPRVAVAGGALGQHLSRNRGTGLEFAQYRAYKPGDEPRRIDWKLFARSDRYFVRESERDSQLAVWVLVDASASMAQADGARPDWRKLDAAAALAACVFEVALRQGDRFGLAVLSGDGVQIVPDGAGPRQRDRCCIALDRLRPTGSVPGEAATRSVWEKIPAGALVIALSDFFDGGLVELLLKLAATRRECYAVQLIGADERDFPFRAGHRFRDPESGVELDADGPSARADFLARFAAANAALAQRFAAAGIRSARHELDEELAAPLARLLSARPAEKPGA